MEIVLLNQAAALGIATILGALLGFLYDIVRPPRRRAGRAAAAVIDILYGLIAAVSVFLYTMAAPGGRLGIWELCLMLLGFLIYTWLISDLFYKVTDSVYLFFHRALSTVKKDLKKIRDMTKLFFQNVQK